jgi:DNA-binding response OmpR family regulator
MAKILFVEDDVFIADIYKRKFEFAGFETLNVTDGKSVLRAVRESSFDLILLDLVLPEMNGQEVLRELRGGSYDKSLHIVVFSNLSSAEDREECLRLGADGFISKTEFAPSEVVEEVKRYLRQFEERGRNDSRRKSAKNAGSGDNPGDDPDADGSRGNILFIEDEDVFVEMFGRRLRDEGYRVETRTDGASGLKEALRGGYDLVISDIMLPQMDGTEIAEKIRESDTAKDTPVFLLSASVDDERLRELGDSGAVEKVFVKTEMTPSELAREVSLFLGPKASE